MKGIAGIFFCFTLLSFNFSAAQPLKGLGIIRNNKYASEIIKQTHINWYYNWGLTSGIVTDAEFVPMVWGIKNTDRAGEIRQSKNILLFNEPDMANQSNISPDSATLYTFKIAADLKKRQMVSPAPARTDGIWLTDYFSAIRKKNIKIDVTAIHWYGAPNAELFLRYVDKIYRLFHRPIWITEFAVADRTAKQTGRNKYTPEQIARFMKNAIAGLKQRKYVERYAWFSAQNDDNMTVKTSRLWDKNGNLTMLGKIYASE